MYMCVYVPPRWCLYHVAITSHWALVICGCTFNTCVLIDIYNVISSDDSIGVFIYLCMYMYICMDVMVSGLTLGHVTYTCPICHVLLPVNGHLTCVPMARV